MDSIKNDSRFSHIASDPRFRPMPKSKKKVKIDSRFQSIFTNPEFNHRTDIDKRGRPTLTGSKKQKHVMERFYDMSDSESDSNESDESESNLDVDERKTINNKKNQQKSEEKLKKRKIAESTNNSKAKKVKVDLGAGDLLPSHEKGAKANGSKVKPGKIHKIKDEVIDEEESGKEEDESEDTYNDDDENEDDGDDVAIVNSEGEDDVSEDESEEEVDEDIIEYTQDHQIEETEVDHKWSELHTDAPAVTDSTYRLAVCNMDWDFVKARDLYVLFKSFVPEGGAVNSVTIYPSEFGKERMREEALLGPREMRKGGGEVVDEVSQNGKKKKDKSCGGDQQKAKRIEKQKESVQTEKLREYQLNRLRYYYAVVECDSVRTADNVYSECDGREYQLSSVRLDLRFIPDDMTFDDEPKEQFHEEQGTVGYEPSKFKSTALCQAKVEVTWDETDFDRLSRKMSGLQPKELQNIVEENIYADIIAPPESDDSDTEGGGTDRRPQWLKALLDEEGDGEEKEVSEKEKIRLYRKALMDQLAEEEEEEKKEEGELDKELEWTPGLKSAAEKKMKKSEKKKDQNAIVGEYLEKRKEKKKKKKEVKLKKRKEESQDAESGDEDLAFSDDDLPAGFGMEDMKELMKGEDDLLNSSKTKKGKKVKKGKSKVVEDEELSDTEKQARAELELMLMDGESAKGKKKVEEDQGEGVSKKSKKNKKLKNSKLAKQKKLEQDDFALDLEDPRFSALYSSHHFHIDPTAPQFKKTKNMVKLVDAQIQRKTKKGGEEGRAPAKQLSDGGDEAVPSSKSVSQSLVESLKRKMKKK